MHSRPRLLLGLAAAIVALAVPAAPAGAITFGPAVTVNGPRGGASLPPAVAVDAAGDVVVAWARAVRGGVYAAYRPRGGSFTSPQLLSGRRVEGTNLQVAIAESGEALVAWGENETLAALGRARARVVVARRAAGGSRFGAPRELSRGQRGATTPALAMTGSGEAVAVWQELRLFPTGLRTGPLRVSAATRPAGGPWSDPIAISDTQARFTTGGSTPQRERQVPRVAVLPSGAALAVWERASGASTTCCQRVEAAVRPAGGSFGPAGALTEAPNRGLAVLRDVKVAATRFGVLAWNEAALALYERGEAGGFAPSVPIPGALDRFGEAALALAPDGAATVVKAVPLDPSAACESVPGAHALSATSRPAGGAFGTDHPVGPATQPASGAAAVVAGGRSLFSWDQPRSSELDEQEPIGCHDIDLKPFGADAAPGSDPGDPVRASNAAPDGFWSVLAADPAGQAVLAWLGGNARVRVARAGGGSLGHNRYPDIVPPQLRSVRVRPSRVSPGARIAVRFRLSERGRITVRLLGGRRLIARVRATRRAGARRVLMRAPARRGTYAVELSARDFAGNPSDIPPDATFRVR